MNSLHDRCFQVFNDFLLSLLGLHLQTVPANKISPCEAGRGGASTQSPQSRYSRRLISDKSPRFKGGVAWMLGASPSTNGGR